MLSPLPFAEAARGVRVRLRVTPRARATRIEGLLDDAHGSSRLRVRVTEPADEGRANAAVLALLAREWRLPKSALTVVSGGAERCKTIEIAGNVTTIMEKLSRWSLTQHWMAGR